MSFILEALKKSEKNRQKSSAPNLETQHHNSVKTPTKRPLWIGMLVLFVLLFNGVALIWLFGPWQQPKVQPQEQPLSASSHMNTEHAESTAVPVVPQPVTTIDTQAIVVKQPQPTVVAVAPTAEPKQPTAVTIRELPAHIQQQLPSFTMSVHGYTGDNNSLIRLNNKIMRQGSTLDGRYRLEEITPDGAIFSYQGYWFKISRTGR
ncbi:MAG: general secretion pathway protein GspB [Deltaproteobacteria bacterium]|nr:general secretion pathway protein GspB [Deltaproteobacteria bacterium]